jgi:hypothetical protein
MIAIKSPNFPQMTTLSDIFESEDFDKSYATADINILIIGYTRQELKSIIPTETSYNMVLLFMDNIITLEELVYYGKSKLFYGYEKLGFFKKLIYRTGIDELIKLRLLRKKLVLDYKLNNYIRIITKLGYTIGEMELLLTDRSLFAEVCRRLIEGYSLDPLKPCITPHIYRFEAKYVRENIELYKYLRGIPYVNYVTICNPRSNTKFVSEMDMMKKMYGIPFLNCNTRSIKLCYDRIMDGSTTLTLLAAGKITGTSDITYDDYNSDELIFLLWNRGKYRPYNIPDINACIDGKTIKMVDSYGNVVDNVVRLSKLLRERLRPYITQEIREAYSGYLQSNTHPENAIDVFPMILKILDVVQSIIDIDSIPAKLVSYVMDNREKCKEYLIDMYHMALYFRRWKGLGFPIPYKKIDAEDTTIDPEMTCSSLIDKYRMLLKSNDFLSFLEVCPVYNNNTLIPEFDSMESTFRSTILGKYCIRMASSRFLHTSHRIFTSLFGNIGSKIEDFENITLFAPEELR